MIDNSLEIDRIVSDMKVCKGKWKSLLKRVEDLKRLNQAHTFKLYPDSE